MTTKQDTLYNMNSQEDCISKPVGVSCPPPHALLWSTYYVHDLFYISWFIFFFIEISSFQFSLCSEYYGGNP